MPILDFWLFFAHNRPMINKIPQIKEELERRIKACSKTTFRGFLVFAQEYVNFVDKFPLLADLMDKIEIGSRQSSLSKANTKYKFTFPFMFGAFKHKIKELLNTKSFSIWSKIKHEKKLRAMLTFMHGEIIGKLSEQEILSPKEDKEKLPTEAVKILGLTVESKWEDIEIMFTNEFDIRIRYKGKEFQTNNEAMGFIDKRIGNTPKVSWRFLQILSMTQGLIKLEGLEEKKREKLKKRKQNIS